MPFPFQMTCIDSKVMEVIPIPGILTDLEINLDENSGAKQHKLYYMCFRYFAFLWLGFNSKACQTSVHKICLDKPVMKTKMVTLKV